MVFDLWVPPKPAIIIPGEAVKPLNLALIMAARMAMARVRGAAAAASTWNPADKAAPSVLSNGNLTLSGDASKNICGARGTLSHAASTGLWYFTGTWTTLALPSGNSGIGIGTSAGSLTGGPGGANTYTLSPFSSGWNGWQNGTQQPTFLSPNPARANGTIINVAWNSNTGDLFFGVNGTYYDSFGSSTGTTPTTATAINVIGTMFPLAWAFSDTADGIVLNTQPVGTPSGYANWG